MVAVFLIGASGFVGGQVLKQLSQDHPEFAIRALVRDAQVGKRISDLYPRVEIIVGGLDDDLVEVESSRANIVLTYWVQISGASLLAARDLASPDYDVGLPSSKVYDDLEGRDEVRSLIRDHPSREIDNYLLDVGSQTPQVKTAIVFPPIIYGKGDGPVHRTSIQIPSLARVTLERGHGVRVGAGENRWGHVHVADVARIFTGLAEAAAVGRDDASLWNDDGLYLASTSDVSFAHLSNLVVKAASEKGLIKSTDIQVLSKEESANVLPGGPVFFGSNARGIASRAKELLGWKQTEHGIEEEIPRAVAEEASNRTGK
ncbi:Nucleoside-diphosphate-sugar epimerase [Geosmithia morbida]|uniref:Nucleoside-diphosphate-sugar epimerase n=1 Tax=Geosmithia morbida TaxID=1094350 RepID=A0A9P4YPK8_9HYPO|nr:Nucleoside-diphosphate-sugar epimerase [Geosmithia morbida]KAF4120786.1 Nucleoside-diphosphate-sugar epimerase [Geosmithia morbida]